MKKVSLAAARIYMSCIERRAKLRKPPATMQSNPYSPRESLSSSPVSRSRCIFFSSSLSFPALSLSVHLTHVRVFRARLRFRSLDAKGRLIVTPFLSAAFTAAVTRLVGKTKIDRREEGQSIFRQYTSRPINLSRRP